MINRNLHLLVQAKPEQVQGPKILLFDLETAPALCYTFGRFKQNISQSNIVEEGGWLICCGFKWLGSDEPVQILFDEDDIANGTDFSVVVRLWELFEEADAVIAHNGKNFDVRMLQARVLFHGLSPLPSVKILDTLEMARKSFRLPSNKLDSIASFLGLGRKEDTGGISLWIDTMNGDKEALSKMLSYCKQDVNLLEQVYLRLRPFGHHGTNFNAAHYHKEDSVRCPVCGSDDLYTRKTVYTALSEFHEVVCNSCGATHRTRESLNTKEKRKNILVPLST